MPLLARPAHAFQPQLRSYRSGKPCTSHYLAVRCEMSSRSPFNPAHAGCLASATSIDDRPPWPPRAERYAQSAIRSTCLPSRCPFHQGQHPPCCLLDRQPIQAFPTLTFPFACLVSLQTMSSESRHALITPTGMTSYEFWPESTKWARMTRWSLTLRIA